MYMSFFFYAEIFSGIQFEKYAFLDVSFISVSLQNLPDLEIRIMYRRLFICIYI